MTYFDAPYRPADLTVDSSHSLANGLLLWAPLTEGSGTTADCIVHAGHTGTQSGGVSWASDSIGSVASFDGVDDYFDFGTFSSYFPGPSITGSLSAWVKWFSGRGIIIGNQVTGNERLYIGVDGGLWSFGFGNYAWNSGITAGTRASAVSSQWAHIVLSISSGVAKLYVNGTETITKTDTTVSLGGQFTVGAYLNANGFHLGTTNRIQNVRIYDRALSATEVKTLYARPWTASNYDTEALWLSPPASPVISSASEATSLMTDCVGWWPLTEGTGSTATDLVGSNDGTQSGGVSWENSEIGNVASFDGVDDEINIGSITSGNSLMLNGTDATISVWFRSDRSGEIYPRLIDKANGGSGTGGWMFLLDSNTSDTTQRQYSFFVNGTKACAYGDSNPYPTDWTHLVVTMNSSTCAMYENGVPLSLTVNSPQTIPNTTAPCSIGSGGTLTTRHLAGDLSNVRVWSRALTAEEALLLYARPWIGAEYNETAPLYPPVPSSLTPLDSSSINTDLQGWWPLTETDDFASGAADISGNGNNGTQTGGVLSEFSELGTVASFDGSNDRFSISTDLSRNQTAFSCSAWIRPDLVDRRFIWYESNSLNALQARFGLRTETSGNLQCVGRDDDGDAFTVFAQSGSGVVSTNKWQHVVGIFDPTGNGCKVFLDGVDVTSSSVNTGDGFPDTASLVQSIGTASTNYYWFDGLLSNVRVWSRALSATEVADIYYSPWLGSSAYPPTGGGTPSYFVAAQFNRLGIGPRFRRL